MEIYQISCVVLCERNVNTLFCIKYSTNALATQNPQVFQDVFLWSLFYDMALQISSMLYSRNTAFDSGAHFTNNFSITIQMWWKFHFAPIQILIKWSLQYLAHGTTAGLSWHVPNFFCDMVISNWIRAKWNFHRIWIVMEKSLVKWAPVQNVGCHSHAIMDYIHSTNKWHMRTFMNACQEIICYNRI